jgi:hypothetical protein
LTFLEQRFHRRRVARDQVRRPVTKPLLQRLVHFLKHRHLVSTRARERGGELVHAGQVALAGQDDEFGRVRHAPPAMLAIMTTIERVRNSLTASLMVHLFRCDLSRFLEVGQFVHDALAELYSTSGDFVKRTSVLP